MTTEQALIQQALAGDAAAKRALATRLLGVITRQIGILLAHRAAPSRRDPRQELLDLAQDVLVLLFEQNGQELLRWDPARGRSLDSFVQLVTRRRVARILSGGRGNPWSSDPTAPDDLEALFQVDQRTVDALEARHQLGGILERLQAEMSARDAEVFQLLFVEERAPEEVCEVMAMTRAALNTWRYRLRKLVKSLADEAESAPAPSPAMSSRREMS